MLFNFRCMCTTGHYSTKVSIFSCLLNIVYILIVVKVVVLCNFCILLHNMKGFKVVCICRSYCLIGVLLNNRIIKQFLHQSPRRRKVINWRAGTVQCEYSRQWWDIRSELLHLCSSIPQCYWSCVCLATWA